MPASSREVFFALPNKNIKILKSNYGLLDDFILCPMFICGNIFDFLKSNFSQISLFGENLDVLMCILHFYILEKKLDGLLYLNTDDILSLRGIKKNRKLTSGFKKDVRERILKSIVFLAECGVFKYVEYKNFNFSILLNEKFEQNFSRIIKINPCLLKLNPYKKSWHKNIGLYLTFLKEKKNTSVKTLQIKKILSNLSLGSLFPFQIRKRFEEVLDYMVFSNVITGWQYSGIDENELASKNWLFYWLLLSVKFSF